MSRSARPVQVRAKEERRLWGGLFYRAGFGTAHHVCDDTLAFSKLARLSASHFCHPRLTAETRTSSRSSYHLRRGTIDLELVRLHSNLILPGGSEL